MLMWRPDISLKKLLLDLMVQLRTSGNCVWALIALVFGDLVREAGSNVISHIGFGDL
jgi:hypothetical protein